MGEDGRAIALPHTELRLLANRLQRLAFQSTPNTTRRMTRQTYRRRERENRNERPAGKHYQHSGCFDYTAEAIEPSYPGFDGLGRPRTDADP
jgi:hypothetical protein